MILGGGSIPPRINKDSFSIIYDISNMNLNCVTNSESDNKYLSYALNYHIEFKKDNFLTPIVLQLDDHIEYVILSTDIS